jgi:hypothetical protein
MGGKEFLGGMSVCLPCLLTLGGWDWAWGRGRELVKGLWDQRAFIRAYTHFLVSSHSEMRWAKHGLGLFGFELLWFLCTLLYILLQHSPPQCSLRCP